MIIRLIRFFVITWTSIAYGPVFSQEATLCNPHEEIYFSCHFGKKLLQFAHLEIYRLAMAMFSIGSAGWAVLN
ncbi:hypothetical protein LMG22037_06584 [Paraburkholderia phenoliruptrix]|uniref:Uncharacterized protein n=1 Tax=Paraburkholderia phenoliruptrix TaxID=252970 RepID=A0A6J5CNH1_9BURK|nr:hypothetical protein LMG22037_06584 [Paraburkholderia phenoliruptrix]